MIRGVGLFSRRVNNIKNHGSDILSLVVFRNFIKHKKLSEPFFIW